MMGNITNGNLNNITGFINLLIYHLNREESHIIKILILKFYIWYSHHPQHVN